MRVGLHVRRQTIHIDAENAAPEVLLDALGVVVAVVEAAGVARSPVEVTIGTETAGVDVVNAGWIRDRDEGLPAGEITRVEISIHRREARNADKIGIRDAQVVGDEELPFRGELRMQRDAFEAHFIAIIIEGQRHEERAIRRGAVDVVDEPDLAVALTHEHPVRIARHMHHGTCVMQLGAVNCT